MKSDESYLGATRPVVRDRVMFRSRPQSVNGMDASSFPLRVKGVGSSVKLPRCRVGLVVVSCWNRVSVFVAVGCTVVLLCDATCALCRLAKGYFRYHRQSTVLLLLDSHTRYVEGQEVKAIGIEHFLGPTFFQRVIRERGSFRPLRNGNAVRG